MISDLNAEGLENHIGKAIGFWFYFFILAQ